MAATLARGQASDGVAKGDAVVVQWTSVLRRVSHLLCKVGHGHCTRIAPVPSSLRKGCALFANKRDAFPFGCFHQDCSIRVVQQPHIAHCRQADDLGTRFEGAKRRTSGHVRTLRNLPIRQRSPSFGRAGFGAAKRVCAPWTLCCGSKTV